MLTLTLSLCACGGNSQGGEAAQTTTVPAATDLLAEYGSSLTLAYTPNDSLNPYRCDGEINRALMPLIYDPLYTLDKTYCPVPVLALSGGIDGLAVTVHLNTAAVFSDGRAVEAADVVYSFNLAKACAAYSAELSNIASALAVGGSQVDFKLAKPDIYALNALAFPIIPVGSADSADNVPAGTGRYMPRELDGEKYLTLNTSSLQYGDTAVKNIMLYPVSENGQEIYLMRTGKIDFLFDALSSGSYERLAPSYTDAPMNNMVYLGLNGTSESSLMKYQWLRRAVSAGLDTAALARTAFLGHAAGALAPVNPDFYDFNQSAAPERETAVSILESNGFTSFTSDGDVRTNGRVSLSVKLIVSRGNAFKESAAEFIKEQLSKCGIGVRVSVLGQDEFLLALAQGGYDMYIGETLMPCNMSLDAFFTEDGALSYGIDTAAAGELDAGFRSGIITAEAFTNGFYELSPFVPLCFRRGVAYYTGSAETVEPLCCDRFANVFEWELPVYAE
ncbi:MAG: hypothetical protein GX851_06930 [Clostridiales bacterium]|nr:hypothetical protein [Clostridiales bacterium]